ncbi:hypothetical protein M0P98_01475 [bacterium]|nr:hypothetical protein [bacterium]
MKYIQQLEPEPPQPEEKDWGFIKILSEPLHQPFKWKRLKAKEREASLKYGVKIINKFPDKEGLLETAFEDFKRFFECGEISVEGTFPIVIKKVKTSTFEEYIILIKKDKIEVQAGDTEGIRRGLVYLEDELLRSGGPFLKYGKIKRTPVIKTRISRCCYGPINRPPKNRDELNDDIDYYPDEYLNRLAHNGVNGLWLTITFADTVPSKIIPEYGKNSEKRLKKLRATVDKCRRYGIKIYPFCIEPIAFAIGDPMIKKYPELQGHNNNAFSYFCTSTDKGKAYIKESIYNLFSSVPNLGGLINISVGERPTNCYAGTSLNNNCPLCSKREPAEVVSEMLSIMAKSMHKANPSAQLISWHYSQYVGWGEKATEEAAGKMPKNIVLQFNFESAGRTEQLGKVRYAGDYWLSYVGPSNLFKKCAINAVKAGTPIFAKIQVSCSHEVATVPWISVPSYLYRKFKSMHKLGVTGVMECWFFGAYPGLMTKAAGELSFAPFPKNEDVFLKKLAGCWWQADTAKTVEAWELFRDAYSNYPVNAMFGYYGPMHDGPVWPLHLKPQNKPLAPTYLINYPPSGDRIGQSFTFTHTIPEILSLCKNMSEEWNKGVKILKKELVKNQGNIDIEEKLRVDEALGIQFESGYHILRFYDLREKLFEMEGLKRLNILKQMKQIVVDELDRSKQLLELTKKDPRLGFHAEAEGYKYFPEKILWRMKWLEQVLKEDFPYVEKEIKKGNLLFPEYTGKKPPPPVYRCKEISKTIRDKTESIIDNLLEENLPFWFYFDKTKKEFKPETGKFVQKYKTFWKAFCIEDALNFIVKCQTPNIATLQVKGKQEFEYIETVQIQIETRRLFPPSNFVVDSKGEKNLRNIAHGNYTQKDSLWNVTVKVENDSWTAFFRIPYKCLPHTSDRYRLNIVRGVSKKEGERGLFKSYINKWIDYKTLPKNLLAFGREDPAYNFGWLIKDE